MKLTKWCCKVCGGALPLPEGRFVECESCGTLYLVESDVSVSPSLDIDVPASGSKSMSASDSDSYSMSASHSESYSISASPSSSPTASPSPSHSENRRRIKWPF